MFYKGDIYPFFSGTTTEKTIPDFSERLALLQRNAQESGAMRAAGQAIPVVVIALIVVFLFLAFRR